MARDRSPKCRQCRREGMKLFLKGERCLTEKCAIERRSYPPGEHGRGRIKQSEYLLQLREKQKARRYYGLLEKQFRTYYAKATKATGVTGEALLRMLETRLDNVVYRLGFAASRAHASAVTCAAKGVDLREPLNPAEPADSHTITLPSLSVSATIVLLNDVLMCACPIAMFFRTRRRVRPRAAVFRGGAMA